MTRQLDTWIDAEQRYAEDPLFHAFVESLADFLQGWSFRPADLGEAVLVLYRHEREQGLHT